MISIRFFFLHGPSNRQARIFTRNTREERSGRINGAVIEEIGSGGHGRTVPANNEADPFSGRIDARWGNRDGSFRNGAIDGHKKKRRWRRCRTWMYNFDPMNTE